MPTNPSRYVVALLLVAVLAAGVLLSGRGSDTQPSIGPAEFERTLKSAEDQAVPVLGTHSFGEELSAADAATLRSAREKLKGLQGVDPRSVVPFFLGGRIDQVLGNGDSAVKELRQAIANIETKGSKEPAMAATLIETHYLLSLAYFGKHEYELAYQEADTAVKAIPNSALYHAARASAALQSGRIAEARSDLAVALKLDPDNPKARQLDLLLNRR